MPFPFFLFLCFLAFVVAIVIGGFAFKFGFSLCEPESELAAGARRCNLKWRRDLGL
jgi:hypothetical protein